MNLLNQQLKAIQSSKAYVKKELEKETNPHIQEKLKHYLKGLEKEEQQTLDQLNIRLNDITLTEDEGDK